MDKTPRENEEKRLDKLDITQSGGKFLDIRKWGRNKPENEENE